MSIRTKTKRERLAEREEAIVSAASRMFLDKGMRATRMSEIASAADLAEGTLYLYFRNKEALFAAVVARHWRELTAGASAVVAHTDEPAAQLEALARFTFARILEDWKLFELSFVLHYGSGEADDASDKRGYARIFDGVIQRGIDRGEFHPTVPVRLLRDLFFGTMEYAVRSMLRSGRQDDREEVIAMLLTAMHGVLGPTRPLAARPDLAARLETAVDRLEGLLGQRG